MVKMGMWALLLGFRDACLHFFLYPDRRDLTERLAAGRHGYTLLLSETLVKKKKVPSHTVGKSLRAQRDTLLPFLFFKVGKGSG